MKKTTTPPLYGIRKRGKWLLLWNENELQWVRFKKNKFGLYPVWMGDKETAEQIVKDFGGRVIQL